MAKTYLGLNAKAYINTSTSATPTWSELTDIKDLKIPLDHGEGDVSTRGGGGWELTAATLIKAGVEFNIVYDTSNTNWGLLQQAWLNRTVLDMAIMDGTISVTGAQGLRSSMAVFKFDQNEELDGVLHNEVSVKPTRGAVAPTWYTAP